MQLKPCRITTVGTVSLDGKRLVTMLVDGEPFITDTADRVNRAKSFFEEGYRSKLLNNSQKNVLMKHLEHNFPYLRLYGCDVFNGEPLLEEEPIRAGKIDPNLYYEEVKLYHAYEGKD